MCTKLQSVSEQLRDLQQEHQQTLDQHAADLRLLVTSVARLQKNVNVLGSVSSPFSLIACVKSLQVKPFWPMFKSPAKLMSSFFLTLLHYDRKSKKKKKTYTVSLYFFLSRWSHHAMESCLGNTTRSYLHLLLTHGASTSTKSRTTRHFTSCTQE